MVLCVWVQVPELVGDHVDSVDFRPGRMTRSVFDFPTDDGAVTKDRVGVELYNQVSGACS